MSDTDPSGAGDAPGLHRAGNAPGPHPSRLSPDHPHRREILAAHDAAVATGSPGYLDPVTGLYVLTADYLAARGTCCTSGCRHCPYLA
jgi:hypothetical protein